MLAFLRQALRRLRLLARRDERERAMDDEMRFHVAMEAAELARQGVPEPEARRRAHVAFGGVERFKEAARDQRGVRWIEDLGQDLRYAVRQMGSSPGFASATVLTLALGIGTTTMMYSGQRAELNDGSALPNAQRLVYLGQGEEGCRSCVTMAPANYLTLSAESRSLERVFLIADWEPVLRGAERAELVDAARVTGAFFQTLGVQALLGRTLVPDDSTSDRQHVLVISETVWRTRFAADSSVLGRSVVLDRVPHTVVGVVPDEAAFWPRGTGMWAPLVLEPDELDDRWGARSRAVGLLGEGRRVEDAAREVAEIGGRVSAAHPDELAGSSFFATPLLELGRNLQRADPAALIFSAAVGLVLLVACINLAGMLIARLSTRRRELAVRRALGASSARIARQLVVETMLLTALAALGGIFVATVGSRALIGAPLWLDGRTFLIALGTGLTTGLVIALWPALRFARPPVVDELRQGARLATAGVGPTRGRRALVVAEVALAIVVLAAAGVLAKSFANVYSVAPGFRGERVLALRVSDVEADSDLEERQPIDRLLAMIEAIPGVESAGATVGVPFSHGAGADDFEVDGRPPALDEGRPEALMQAATPRYFETLEIPLLRGRAFTESDDAGSAPVAIVNRALAERVFLGEEAIGRGLIIDGTRWEVVGLVGDVFHGDVETIREPEIYRPLQQWSTSRVWIVVRTRADPAGLSQELVGTAGRFDPDMVITRMLTMDELRASDMGSERRMLRLMGAFAAAAVLITAIGLYGLVSYSAAQRTREFGVRLALGAGKGVVLRMVLAEGVRLAALGAALGILGALAALPVMRAMLFGVSPSDPVTLVVVGVLVCGIGLLAAYLPARRATRVDPVASLSEG